MESLKGFLKRRTLSGFILEVTVCVDDASDTGKSEITGKMIWIKVRRQSVNRGGNIYKKDSCKEVSWTDD